MQHSMLLYYYPAWWPIPIHHHTESNRLGWLGYHWRLPIQLQGMGLKQLNFVDQDKRCTTTPATTFDPDGIEVWVNHESVLAGSWTQSEARVLALYHLLPGNKKQIGAGYLVSWKQVSSF
jgi:hypothetical protein